AGGLLSGKHKFENDDTGRFNPTTVNGKMYRARYWQKIFFEAVESLTKTAQSLDLTLLEASLRWMSHHSGLDPTKDGIIIGATSIQHLEENLTDLKKGPLPEEMVKAFDEAWEHVKVACPSYFKSPADTAAAQHMFNDDHASHQKK
ncbi:hypothetical protein BGZ83_009532, partial [Gryganskiella cystojenkinii]